MIMCLLIGTAVALHQDDNATPPTAADRHGSHVLPQAIPVAVTTPAPLPRGG